jgi:hypothetical protein
MCDCQIFVDPLVALYNLVAALSVSMYMDSTSSRSDYVPGAVSLRPMPEAFSGAGYRRF